MYEAGPTIVVVRGGWIIDKELGQKGIGIEVERKNIIPC